MTLNAEKLTAEEIAHKFPSRGHMDLAEYESLLAGLKPHEGFVIELNGVSVRAMKRRLGQAAKKQLGENAKLRYDVETQGNITTISFILRAPGTTKAASGRKRT